MNRKTCCALAIVALAGCKPAHVARPNLPIGYVDAPHPGETIGGVYTVRGFAVSENGIREVDIYVDREFSGSTRTGIERKDLVKPFPFTQNPVQGGWEYQLNAFSLLPGRHEISVNAITNDGSSRTIGNMCVNVNR